MSEKKKVVLVFDKPDNCVTCPCLGQLDGVALCDATGEAFSNSQAIMLLKNVEFAPSWCPLKPLPAYRLDWTKDANSYGAGFNDCLDAIGGARK